MPSTYSPDGWVIVKIFGTDPHYRVFGSFYGGYLEGDSWKLNSGIVGCKYLEPLNAYQFDGFSGSIYYCNKDSYGKLRLYNQSVLDNFINKSHNTMEVLEDCSNWTTTDWILK